MMMNNDNLYNAKLNKDDEFYTLYEDIETEMNYYKDYLEGKIIYCNCDTKDSNFVKFFNNVKEDWKIKEVIYSSIEDGGFEGHTDLLDYCDIVITNPPFSKIRKFLDLLVAHNKDYIFIGNKNSSYSSSFFKLIKNNKLFINTEKGTMDFERPDGTVDKVPAVWYTNIPNRGKKKKLKLNKSLKEISYQVYDNYDAINIDRISNIPNDYYGLMGVPVTLPLYDYEDKFDILYRYRDVKTKKYTAEDTPNFFDLNNNGFTIKDGDNIKSVYSRIIIKRKVNNG